MSKEDTLRPAFAARYFASVTAMYGGRYDYSKANYTTLFAPITIICPDHGQFEREPQQHRMGRPCPDCRNIPRYAVPNSKVARGKEWIDRARARHGDKFDYVKVAFERTTDPVTIVCPEHGDIELTPKHHLDLATGCPRCSWEVGGIDSEEAAGGTNVLIRVRERSFWGRTAAKTKRPGFDLIIEPTDTLLNLGHAIRHNLPTERDPNFYSEDLEHCFDPATPASALEVGQRFLHVSAVLFAMNGGIQYDCEVIATDIDRTLLPGVSSTGPAVLARRNLN